jgi:hypothetical protein
MQAPSAVRPPGERALLALAIACAALLVLLFALPMLLGRIYIDSDLRDFYVPVRFFYQNALRAGSEFLWFPYEFGGFYLHGEGQAGLYHPLNLISYRWLPLALAFDLELLRSYVLSLLGSYLLLRRHELPAAAALFGATLYAFSPFHLLHYMHPNLIAATAHLPWLLLALDVMARGTRPLARALAAPAFALLSASQLLVGHPQAVWMSWVGEGLYALWLWRGGAGLGVCARAAGAKALGALCAAIQLLPTWDSLRNSTRATPPEGFRESLAIAPLDLVQLVQPYLFTERVLGKSTHELGIYAGAFGALALAWMALAPPLAPPARRLARVAVGLALLGVLLALGPTGGLYRAVTGLPVVGLFRAPGRYVFFLHCASALAAALLFTELLRRPRCEPSPDDRTLALSLPLLSGVLGLTLTRVAPEATTGIAYAGLGFVLVSATGLAFLLAAAGRRDGLALLLLLSCLDLGVYGYSYIYPRKPGPVSFELFYAEAAPPEYPPGYRALIEPIPSTMRGTRMLSGYVALWPRRQLPVLPDDLRDEPQHGEGRELWRAAMRVSSVAVDGIPAPLPRARLVTQAQVSQDAAADLLAIDVETTALVPEAVELDAGPPGEVRFLEEGAGTLALATDAPGRQLLVLSESFHEGWRVRIDGRPAERFRVYGDFLGCVVPPGRHELRWHFEPASFVQGARLSALGLAGVGAWIGAVLLQKRYAKPQPIET